MLDLQSFASVFSPLALLAVDHAPAAGEIAHEVAQHAASHQPLGLWEGILESNALNVALVAVFLIWILKKNNAFAVLDETVASIKADVADANQLRQEAETNLARLRGEIEASAQTVDAIAAQAQQSANLLAAQTLQAAEEEAQRLTENAQRRLEAEARALKAQLQAQLVEATLEETKTRLQQELTPAQHEALIDQFIDRLPSLRQPV